MKPRAWLSLQPKPLISLKKLFLSVQKEKGIEPEKDQQHPDK
jgi:hypothetical protein